jgi:UDP-glucose 4-epimerase
MKILVTGGAGYIGSITINELQKENFEVIAFDSLEYGHKKAINCPLVIGRLQDKKLLEETFKKNQFDAVIHFAGYIQMGESMEKPGMYFDNNIGGALSLLETMVLNNVKKIVFSSTAGVYGNPVHLPIKEDDPKNPTNPYGESKLMVEKLLKWYHLCHGINSVSVRYFNAAGATLDGSLGEDHQSESHLIPNAINAALSKKTFEIFGKDYSTKDGTCIRDYIHVLDLAASHISALQSLNKEQKILAFYNAGTGRGYSNKQVVEMIKKVTGLDFKVKYGPRRPGDANELVADPTKIKKELGFNPKYSDLQTIVKTAHLWHRSHPKGFQN